MEQTVVSGEVGHTIRTLFNDGRFRGDDTLGADQPQLAAQFAPGRGSALLIGLGTGQGAASLKRAGFGEIAVAEPAAGIVKAARACFGAVNEGIPDDPRLQLFLDDGRSALLSSQRLFDPIAIEPGATELDWREFYQLVRSRLQPGGALQQSLSSAQTSAEEIAAAWPPCAVSFPTSGFGSPPAA